MIGHHEVGVVLSLWLYSSTSAASDFDRCPDEILFLFRVAGRGF